MAIRVLVVDDHRMFAEALASTLAEQPDIEVARIAGNGAEAAQAMSELEVDVVLLDHRMPDATGLQVAPDLVRDHPTVRIVMLSAETGDALLTAALKAGCVGYVNKMDSLDQLVAAVRAAHAGTTAISPSMLAKLTGGEVRPRGQDLTPRELQVLAMLAEGMSNSAIAGSLSVSTNTVRNHVQSVIEKLGAHSKLEAVTEAIRQGLVSSPT